MTNETVALLVLKGVNHASLPPCPWGKVPSSPKNQILARALSSSGVARYWALGHRDPPYPQ